MQESLSKYKIEILIVAAILVVMFSPYFILHSGLITSVETLQQIEMMTKQLTPLVMGLLCGIIVYRAIKRNREDS